MDLQYAMSFVSPQTTTLFQVEDVVAEGSLTTLLEAVDASYCAFEVGDSKDPNVDGQYPDKLTGRFTSPENCGGVTMTNVISTSYSSNEADLTASTNNDNAWST